MSETSYLKISWRIVALASLLLNFIAVATVVVIANLKNADALSTVALALSVLAFISQLIIYSVQTWQSTEQLNQARDLNSQTLGLLSDTKARVEGTHRMVSDQYTELMHLTALKARSAIESEAAQSPDSKVNSATASDAITVIEKSPTSSTNTGSSRSLYWNSPITWPEFESVRAHVEIFEGLTNESKSSFISSIDIDILGERIGINGSLSFAPRSDQILIDRGLLSFAHSDRVPEVEVTSLGRLIGRILLADWPPPKSYESIVPQVRKLRDDLESAMDERLSRMHHNAVSKIR